MTENHEKRKGCRVRLVKDTKLGWMFTLDPIDQHCKDELQRISEKLGPHSKRYLAKRLKTPNPEEKQTLKELGLR